MSCRLCGTGTERWILQKRELTYHHCPDCGFIQLDPGHHLADDDARKRYQLHCNEPENEGYLNWLRGFIERAVLPWKTGGEALDFGSGPVPQLVRLLSDAGFSVCHYDLHFHPDDGWQQRKFDLITLCEVIEHVVDPRDLLQNLSGQLKAGGILAVRTRFRPGGEEEFMRWWYREDPTHISFFSPENLSELAGACGLQVLEFLAPDIAVFQRI